MGVNVNNCEYNTNNSKLWPTLNNINEFFNTKITLRLKTNADTL